MARLERKRGMFFGSWTGQPIEASAVADTGGSSLTASVTVKDFSDAMNNESGEYTFIYDSTNSTWTYNSTAISMDTYGIEITGSPSDKDSVIIRFTAKSSGWEVIGKDNDELSKELNPDTETTKNVLGETTFKHSGYEPEISVDPYYMDPSRVMYAHLLECALEERYGEGDLLGYFAEAFFTSANEETKTMSGYCYVRRAWFIPQSVGGDTSGYAIPYNINPVGAMTKKNITYDMTTNEVTITDIA